MPHDAASQDLVALRAVVTGGASGIGAALVHELASRGARIACIDIAPGGADVVAGLPGGPHLFVQADVTDEPAVNAAVASAASHLGGVNAVCNAAGIPDDGRRCEEVSLESWRHVLAVDLDSSFLVTRAALPHLRTAGGGAIVNIGSIASVGAQGGGVAYTAAKHAVLGLTRRLAQEYGPEGIRVNAVCPGYVATPMNLAYREMLTDTVKSTAAGRWAEPAEIARIAAFLLSDAATYMVGSVVMADGGSTL